MPLSMAISINRNKVGRNLILLAVICGFFGAIALFKPISLALYSLQSRIVTKPVSGDIVVVGVDSASLNDIGRWPWPREKQAELFRKIDSYGPKAFFIDIGYQGRTTSQSDESLRQTLQNMKTSTVVIAKASRSDDGSINTVFSNPDIVGSTATMSPYAPYLYGYIWSLPSSIDSKKGQLIGFSAKIAGVKLPPDQYYDVDYSFDPNSIPIFSAKDVMSGSINVQSLRGKKVIFAITDITLDDVHTMPRWGERPGSLFAVLGAETLKNGLPINFGWMPFYIVALVICAVFMTNLGLKYSRSIAVVSSIVLIIFSCALVVNNIGNEILPAIVLILASSFYVGRKKAALLRTARNDQTGFSDMSGYLVDEVVSNNWIIAASAKHLKASRGYISIANEPLVMKEIGRRLCSVIDEQQLTHNDQQQFLWEMPPMPTQLLVDHLEGLRKLFNVPIIINDQKVDVDIFFGVDRNIVKNIKSRTDNALLASKTAMDGNATYIISTSASFDKNLKTQFWSDFEIAVRTKDVELFFEAQPDLKTNQVHSAEASIRWIHPAYGLISTAKLMELAKDSERLSELSLFLCEQAFISASQLNIIQPGFSTSIKISMETLTNSEFVNSVVGLSVKARCPAQNIIFDIVDVKDNMQNTNGLRAIEGLRTYGFRIGIGSFGLSSTDITMIHAIKPDEIFLVKSFCTELLGSTSSQTFTDAVLRIANDYNIISVADGIDDRDILVVLKKRGCTRGKGKIIAMPLNLDNFIYTHMNQKQENIA